ncbi:hypothetical protein ACA910_000159 [Epithemia clementina (nom. ined.)]
MLIKVLLVAFFSLESSTIQHASVLCFSFSGIVPSLPVVGRIGKQAKHRQTSYEKLDNSKTLLWSSVPSWHDLEHEMGKTYRAPVPSCIDSVLQPATPKFSTDHPTLFRERHGWCPYSERVWLSLELLSVPYDTILIDNTGGPRPPYYSGGQTPQMKWPSGQQQGESMDLVQRLDSENQSFDFQMSNPEVKQAIAQFRSIFPSRARPSSRAAFLFQSNGEPLFRSTFEDTLLKTDQLLSESGGPFFTGEKFTAADIAWAPFLERYRYQLPCLHIGLCPDDQEKYPHLSAWYDAMDHNPEYACRVKGNSSSWRKVLLMAGFGNAGMVPPNIAENVQSLIREEDEQRNNINGKSGVDLDLWQKYAEPRPHVAPTPRAQVAQIISRNRDAILKDTLKQIHSKGDTIVDELPSTLEELDETMRELAEALLGGDDGTTLTNHSRRTVGAFASFLNNRMCVPRDMGAMPAASLQHLAWQLQTYN